MKLQKGNIFTPVCQSLCSGGCLPQCMLGYHPWADTPWADTPSAQTPLGRHSPAQCMLGYTVPSACWDRHATAADIMHPTGMHSCCYWNFLSSCSKASKEHIGISDNFL